ncbi:uncharacterized protein ACRADG_011644 [Cochliomyia hominivorax]
MYISNRLFLLFLYITNANGYFVGNLYPAPQAESSINFYRELVIDMKRQRSYEGILIAQNSIPQDSRLQVIYRLAEPKIIISDHKQDFYYRGTFNSEILAVIIMEFKFQQELWQVFIKTINFMRQIRILMILVNIVNKDELKRELLWEFEQSKTTYVLIHFLNTSHTDNINKEYFRLWPYPKYHFQLKEFSNVTEYYPINWKDMKGKTLITLPDQNVPRSIMYKNEKGELCFTGFAFKFVELFTKIRNATYKLLYEPRINEVVHFSTLTNMTNQGILDMPMSVSPINTSLHVINLSYPVELTKWILMIPCARRMKVSQVYEVLLTPELFAIVTVFAIIFSVEHTVIDKLFYNKMIWSNLLMSDKVIPGVLGQPFASKKSHLISLRLVYILIFILGLFMSTLILAHLQTLITSPPYYRHINNFEDLRLSGKRILMDRSDMRFLDKNDYVITEKMKGAIEFTDNTTMFNLYREKFNTSYGYTVTLDLWNIFTNIQVYHAQKSFCTSPGMYIKHLIPFAMPLEWNSQYREATNELVHKMHSAGLLNAWRMQVFIDLLKIKKITLRDKSRIKTYEDLTERDLALFWTIFIIGLLSSLLLFILEIIVKYSVKYCKKYLKIYKKNFK